MDDDQRPWWTRPPEPAAGRPEEQDDASGEDPAPRLNGSHVAAAPTEAFTPEALDEAPAEPAQDLPFGAGRPQRGVRRTVPPSQQLVDEPPPPAAPSAALTEQLPAVPADDGSGRDDALGVYGAPTDVAPGIPGISDGDDPLGHLREEGPRRPALGALQGKLSELPGSVAPKLADRRVLAGIGGVVGVLLVVLLVRGIFGGGPDEDTTANDGQAAATNASAEEPAGTFGGVKRLDGDEAITDLERVKDAGDGDVVGAWEWTDENGRNLFVTMRTPKGRNFDLRVVHAAALQTNTPQTLRVMNDPGLPGCRGGGEGSAGFTKNSVKVTDLDKDGVAEVTVGWTARCGGPSEPSVAKLALLTDGDKYILRGDGVVGETGERSSEPKRAGWPKAYFGPVTEQFDKLFFTVG